MANKHKTKISRKAETQAKPLHKQRVCKRTAALKVTNEELKKKITERKIAEDEIKRFASFPQLNPNPILEIDSSGTIVFCNAAAVQALRKLNLRDTTLYLPDDLSDILDALDQEKDVQFYREVKIKDRIFGEILCLTPQFHSIRIYANDITERKSYQEALKEALHKSKEHEREMSALSNAARAILKYPDFKSTAREIFNYCRQLIGATSGYIALLSKDGTENEVLFLDSGGLPCSVDPELPMPIRGLRAEAYHSMKTVYNNDFLTTDWIKFLPDGHVRLRNVLFAPLITDGKPVGLLGLANKTGGFTDNDSRIASAFGDLAAIALTQKSAEEALRHSEEFYRIVTENASDITTILDANGTIQYESLSIEQVLGYKQEELIGKSAFELIHPDDLPNVMDTFSQGLHNPGITLYVEFRFRHKDRSWRILSVAGKNLLDNPAIGAIVINSRDITDQKQAEKALRSERQRLINILDSMVDGVYIVNQQNDIEYVNPLLEEEYGPVNGRKCHEYFEGRKKPCTWCKNQDVFKGKTVRWEWYSEKTNKTYDLINTPLKNPDGSISKLGIFRDITERKQAEEALKRVNRTLRALSNSDHAMLQAKTEDAFLKDVCKIIVEDCGHAMVWIGFAEDNESKTVRPAASAGFEEGYLETLNITWADTDRGRGPTGTAIRTGRPSICRNMLTDPAFEPWREEAIKRGYASSIVLPLVADGKAFGAVNIYSRKPDPFTEDEVKLLSELASDLSFGITAMRLQVAHAQAEKEIRQSEERYRTLATATFEGVAVTERGSLMDCNDQLLWMLGYTKEELIGRKVEELLPPEERERVIINIREGRESRVEHEMLRKDGSRIIVETHGKTIIVENNPVRFTAIRDVTERKRMEEELRRSRDELEIRVQERTAELRKTVDALHDEIEERIEAQKTIKEQSDILDSLFKDTLTPLVLLDPDCNFVRVNEAYARACRKDIDEFTGHNHFEFYPREENEAIFRKVVEEKFPYQAIAKPFVFPDHPEWGVSYWDWTLTPLMDEYGEVKFLVFSLNDVSERKKAEETIKVERQRLYNVLESIPAYVCLLTPDYTFAYVNQEFKRLFGNPGDKRCYEFLFDRQEPCEGCQTYKIFSEHKTEQQWEWVGPNGNIYSIYDYAFTDADGSPLILEMGLDITERKKALERISITNKLLEFFVTKAERKDYLNSVVDLLHNWTDCNCIGVRVLDKQGHIPYESFTGFSREFWEAENWISVKDHTCACIRVVLQKPDAQDMSMMSHNGSFYCNNTAEFAGSLTERELTRFRGLCIRTGYKSVAIIPIRYKDSVIGALHIADKREGMVPLEKIEFTESVSPLIGEAIFRFSAEEALVKSEASLSDAQRIALMGNWEWDIVSNTLTMSDELYRIFGINPDKFRATYESFLNFVYPDERERVKRAVRDAVQKKEPFDIDFRFIRTNGVVRVMHGIGEGVYDQSGNPLVVKGTGQDITERLKAEAALRESEERYRTLVETMNEGLGMDDENGLLVYANEKLCEMLDYSLEEIIGRPVLSFFDEKDQKILQEQIEKRKRGESEPYRLEWNKRDGQKIITLVSPRGIFNSAGKYKGSFAVITDVTEKLRLESIAEALNTMDNIGFVFSGVRHEIGNPVNSIKMALSVLKQNIDTYSKDKVKEYADRMLSEVSRMEYLLKAMKNFNMYETVELMDTDMTDFMNKFLSLVKGDFEKRGIKIEANILDQAWCYADPRALQQVLLNIMTNAAEALEGREDAQITINVSKMSNMVNIRVEDNGCGMSQEQQEDLFKPFYTSKAKGTGLGLVITKKMMTKMKGFIEVVSEKDKGTIVDIFIPEGISE